VFDQILLLCVSKPESRVRSSYMVITRRDAPDAVPMSLDTFNSLLETVHLLKSPANAAHLARSIEQFRQGQVRQRDLVNVG
jgi:antitoxin YefM